jgi:hypothetical protein
VYVGPDPDALVFPGVMGGPIRRGNFNKLSRWPHVVEILGMPGPALPLPPAHRQPVRRQQRGRTARPDGAHGHDSERAALIYQHKAHCADKNITDAIVLESVWGTVSAFGLYRGLGRHRS